MKFEIIEEKEKQYYSLNGAFGMLAYIDSLLTSGKVRSLEELRNILISGMESQNEEMAKLEVELGFVTE